MIVGVPKDEAIAYRKARRTYTSEQGYMEAANWVEGNFPRPDEAKAWLKQRRPDLYDKLFPKNREMTPDQKAIYEKMRGREGLGFGDVKMLAMIGAVLGWPLMVLTLVLASFVGSVVGVGMMALGRGGMQAALPFGTFLALGALVAAVAGDPILSWYLSFYR